MDEKLRIILTELRRRLQALYGSRLKHLILYGSQARGDAEPGSDIDVLVVLAGRINPGKEIERVGAITAEISLHHDIVISCVFVSTKRYNDEHSPLLLNAHREGMTVV
ncbi:MAG: nucleotidyltransferase domain-containing protein [Anaerolineae bacterium]